MSDNLRTTENVNTRGGAEKMGTMPEGRLLASMAWPAILSMTINALYNIVDSIFVARISQGALTAVSFVLPVQLLMVALTIGSGVGVNSVISRRLGAKRFEEANNAASMSVRIGIFNYLIFLLISIFATVPFMSHYTDDPEIFGHGVTYMRLVFALSIFSSVEVILQKVLQAMGNMKAPMICSVTGCLINVIFDP
ncbi:MAG: MATE family efflux transporter, partial [Firmicutes bacterium]|nr:MATE family efflux transporter [Bacillota bacterium]